MSAPPDRVRLYRAIQARRREMGLADEDTWRDWLQKQTGQTSLTLLTDVELRTLREAMGSGNGGRKSLNPRHAAARALWIKLHDAGVVEFRSDEALDAWARHQTGIDAWSWHDEKASRSVIEGLKAWGRRKGVAL